MSRLQFTTFYVDDIYYGFDILQVGEVLRNIEYSLVPQTHDNVLGLMNLRGAIVTVIDLARALNHTVPVTVQREACVILKTDSNLSADHVQSGRLERVGSDLIGLLVDRMGEVAEIEDSDIDPTPANSSQLEAAFMKGVVKLEDELLTILSLERILNFI